MLKECGREEEEEGSDANNRAVPALEEKDDFSRVWLKEEERKKGKIQMRAATLEEGWGKGRPRFLRTRRSYPGPPPKFSCQV